MPFVDVEGSRLYFRADGHEDGPVLLLSHSLGADHGMWDPQMPDLTRYFRVVRYDARGHGASDAPPGDYTIERLSRDALAVADACGAAAFAFCGLSLGGMVGQWLAAHAAGRLTSVVLANTSPRFPDPSVMETRRRTVLDQGMTGVVDAVLQRFFSLAAERREPMVSSVRRAVLGTDPVGYAGC